MAVLRMSMAIGAGILLLFAQPVEAGVTQLLPGATYTAEVQFTPFGPVVVHVVRAPKPVGAFRLRTVLSHGTVLREERLSSMQKRLAREATMVGVNGDFSRIADGRPNGITLHDGVLATAPHADRSSMGVGVDGILDIRRVGFRATWRGLGQRRAVNSLNDAPGPNGTALFTTDWGRATPHVDGSVAVVLSPFGPATPNTDLQAVVSHVVEGGGSVPISADTAVLVARGNAAARLREEAPLGAPVSVRLFLQPDWYTVSDAVGGGPVLVRDGRPVYHANEAFTVSQLAPRHPRSAVGQLADGRLIFVVVDGRQIGYSVGMTTFEMALTMVRLGAVRAMQLDGGGSSTLAFNGTVLNSPSDGRERPVPTALMLEYLGVYVPPPLEPVLSPNGDGVAEQQRLSYKVVNTSEVSVTLTAPDGSVAYQETVARPAGTYTIPFPPPPPPPPEGLPPTQPQPGPPAEGRWALRVAATDDQGLSSSSLGRFRVNSTLGFLRVEPALLRLRPPGGTATVRWAQARPARVRLTVQTAEGVVVRRVALGRLEPGGQEAAWNGKLSSGKLAPTGRYVVRVTASNDLGDVELDRTLVVRRVVAPKKK